MNASEFFNFLIPTFFLLLISNYSFDSNGSLSYNKCSSKFSNTLVLPDPKPPVIKILKDGREYKAKLACDLFRLIHHNFSSLFKICHDYLVVIITLI